MAISNLETTIEDIEQLIETVRPDSKGKIMLPKDALKQLLVELRNSIPVEIKRFSEKTRELEQAKSKAIEDARSNAERIMNEANAMRDRLLDENEQVKLAEERANQIINEANIRAQDILVKAENAVSGIQEKALKEYDDSLVYMINFIQSTGQETANLLNNNIAVLKDRLNEVMASRRSLHESLQKKRDIENQRQMMYDQNMNRDMNANNYQAPNQNMNNRPNWS